MASDLFTALLEQRDGSLEFAGGLLSDAGESILEIECAFRGDGHRAQPVLDTLSVVIVAAQLVPSDELLALIAAGQHHGWIATRI